jgi:RNA polymerase sigma factor (sigma-70 family)
VHLKGEDAMEDALIPRSAGTSVAELYVRHMLGALRLARLLVGDDQAEDAAQDAFIRAVGRFAHLRRPEAFDAYLRTAVVNECRARSRRARLERTWLARQATREPRVHPPDIESRSEIWDALAALPWRQRAALVLRYYEDLPLDQIGRTLRCSTRAANALLARGLAGLRRALVKEER